jgi:hypothetical protein
MRGEERKREEKGEEREEKRRERCHASDLVSIENRQIWQPSTHTHAIKHTSTHTLTRSRSLAQHKFDWATASQTHESEKLVTYSQSLNDVELHGIVAHVARVGFQQFGCLGEEVPTTPT